MTEQEDKDFRSILGREIYQASMFILEPLEYTGDIVGNSHHIAQTLQEQCLAFIDGMPFSPKTICEIQKEPLKYFLYIIIRPIVIGRIPRSPLVDISASEMLVKVLVSQIIKRLHNNLELTKLAQDIRNT